jgi:hypothetical protein
MPLGFTARAGLMGGGGGFDYSTTGSVTTRTHGIYTTLQWTGSGNFVVNANNSGLTCELLIQAGGAAAFNYNGYGNGGGGAGGFRWLTGAEMPAGTHYISVGGGGSSTSPGTNSYVPAAMQNGGGSWSPNSGSITAYGGGYGGCYPYAHSVAGGSGGGGDGGQWPAGSTGNSPSVSPSQGSSGGTGNSNQWGHYHGAGGGGAQGTGFGHHYSASYMCSYPYCTGGQGHDVNYVTGSTGSGYGISGFAGGGCGQATAGYWAQPYPAPYQGGSYSGGSGAAYSGAGGSANSTGGSGCVVIRFVTP